MYAITLSRSLRIAVRYHGSLVQSLLDNKIEQLQIQIQQMTLFKAKLEEYRTAWKDPKPEADPEEVCPLFLVCL